MAGLSVTSGVACVVDSAAAVRAGESQFVGAVGWDRVTGTAVALPAFLKPALFYILPSLLPELLLVRSLMLSSWLNLVVNSQAFLYHPSVTFGTIDHSVLLNTLTSLDFQDTTHYFFFFTFLFCIGVKPINNVIISGGQQRD